MYVYQKVDGKLIILLFYVDDMQIIRKYINMSGSQKNELSESSDIKDLGTK